MADDGLQTTEDALKELIKQTDKAVAKAQAAMAAVVGKTAPAATGEAATPAPATEGTEAGGVPA